MEHPFYFTWSKQKGATSYNLDGVTEHFIVSEGKTKLDLSSISYQANFGLKPKFIHKSINEQLDKYAIASPKVITELKTSATEKLIKLINLNGGKIFYTVSGAESVENALKMARIYTGKNKILARKPSYHGGTLAAVSVTGDWRNDDVPKLDQWTIRIPEPDQDPDLSQTKKIISSDKEIAAVIVETVPGNNGVLIPPQTWITNLQQLCKENEILFILDEVICGFYRLGTPFGFQKFNLSPDIICLAKGISGGVIPFGGVWTTDKIHNHFNDRVLSCGLTNYAHPLGLAALNSVLDYTNKPDFINHLNELIDIFTNDIKSLNYDSRVIGALAAIDIPNAPDWKTFWDAGLSLVAQKDRIILAPHLNLSIEEWKMGFSLLEGILE